MRIRKLTLFGFKSFPDRTVFSFDPGISCVVGPNGCGKSNVVDALKWCIGEQSARSLRGEDMSDVIFAGSSDRNAVGFAEVLLTLSADKGEPFPGDYAAYTELEVGRRLHRSGTSEYLLNQNKVRRRDVVELFLDTGIGSNLYGFIEQGQVDKMVRASPAERRSIVDEAAGIAKYKIRREEAGQRLTATAQQLDRVSDVVDELGKQRRALEKQVIKAARFRRLRAQIKQDELWLSLVRYQELVRDRRQVGEHLRAREAEVERWRAEGDRLAQRLVEAREQLEVTEHLLDEGREALESLDQQRAEAEGARRSSQEAQQAARAEREKAQQERELAGGAAAEAEREADQALQEAESAERGLASHRVALAEAQEAAEQAQRRRDLLSAQLRSAEASLAAKRAAIAVAEARRDSLEARWPELVERSSEVKGLLHQAEQDRARLARALDAARSAEVETQAELAASRAAFQSAAEEQVTARKAANEAELQVRRAEKELEASVRALSAEGPATQQARQAWERAQRAHRERRQRAEAALAAARQTRQRAVEEAWRQVRDAESEAGRRANAWVRALEHRAAMARTAEEGRWNTRASRLEERARREEARLRGELAQEARQKEQEARRQGQAELQELTAKRQQKQAEQRQANARLAEARRVLATAEASLEAARLKVQQLSLPAAEGKIEGPTLAAALGLGAAEAAALAPRLGHRLTLPVVHEAALLDLLRRQPSVALEVVLEGPDLRRQVVEGVNEAPTPEAALASWRQDRAEVVDRGGRVRVFQDGRVEVGRAADRARALVERLSSLERAQEALTAAESQRALAASRLAEVQASVEQADREVLAAEGRLAEASASQDQRLRELVDAERHRAERVLEDQRLALEAERAELGPARAAAIAAVVAAAQQEVEAARSGLDGCVSEARRAADERAREVEDRGRQQVLELEERQGREEVHDQQALGALEAEVSRLAAEWRLAREADRDHGQLTLDRAREQAAATRTMASEADARAAVEVSRRAAAEAAHERAVASRSRVEQDQASLLERIAQAEAQRTALEERLRALASDRELAAEEVGRARAEVEGEAPQVERLAEEARVANGTLEACRADAARIEQDRALAESRAGSWRERAASAARRRDESLARAQRAAAAEARFEEAGFAAGRSVERWSRELSTLEDARGQRWDAQQRLRQEAGQHRERVSGLEQELGRAREARDAAAAEAEGARVDAERIRLELESLRRRSEERYQLSLPGLADRAQAAGKLVIPVPDEVRRAFEAGGAVVEALDDLEVPWNQLDRAEAVTAAASRLEAHRAELARLGEVNLAALEAYDELCGRHDELIAQRNDLEESIKTIRAAIARMNRECRERFRDAFDRINENFQKSYPRLVGGGQARLSLTDEEDLLETGVEIFAQPPGKRLQNLTLLSGGEKAMTAIALMIAVFQVKPSPFCVLDEVDAPLDEANGARFNDMLREMARVTQFVVITHNRKTMECGDVLLGVTMQRPGVSSLVSVTL